MKAALKTTLLTLLWLAALFYITSTAIVCTTPRSTVLTFSTIWDIKTALVNFHTDYKAWPVIGMNEKKQEVSGDILRVLLGENIHDLNPRKIIYLEPPIARKGRDGISGDLQSPSFIDLWGRPYIVAVTSRPDGKIANPDLLNTDAQIRGEAPPIVDTGGHTVIVSSRGEDGIDNTGDDYVSWRHWRKPPSPTWREKPSMYASYWGCVAIVAMGIGWQLLNFWRFFCEGFEARGMERTAPATRRTRLKEDEI